MSNNTDDAMRPIEESLDEFASYHRDQWQARSHDDGDERRTDEARTKLLATIRAALNAQPSPTSGESPAVSAGDDQKPRSLLELHGLGQGIDHRDHGGWGEDDDRFRANEEHERAVEACVKALRSTPILDRNLYVVHGDDIDEALRLMRRQPKETTDG